MPPRKRAGSTIILIIFFYFFALLNIFSSRAIGSIWLTVIKARAIGRITRVKPKKRLPKKVVNDAVIFLYTFMFLNKIIFEMGNLISVFWIFFANFIFYSISPNAYKLY